MLEHLFILSWIGSIFCVHIGYIVYNIQTFSGLKWSNMFAFRHQYVSEIRKFHLNFILHLRKVRSYDVEILAEMKMLKYFYNLLWEIFLFCFFEHCDIFCRTLEYWAFGNVWKCQHVDLNSFFFEHVGTSKIEIVWKCFYFFVSS